MQLEHPIIQPQLAPQSMEPNAFELDAIGQSPRFKEVIANVKKITKRSSNAPWNDTSHKEAFFEPSDLSNNKMPQ